MERRVLNIERATIAQINTVLISCIANTKVYRLIGQSLKRKGGLGNNGNTCMFMLCLLGV